ncbi:CAAX protease self-immunity [Musa troglodytarum]|uniref:CAAX protease self-immunity n=1 Tax=Musa troglodytarum TaxID=320322 RepID=A0A9E7JMF0_9LILI|nr:CAAX protease self-immunity [Musa troglodytarum]
MAHSGIRGAAAEDDVRCLTGVKTSLDRGHTLSWNFSNATVGFVCSFVGVSCWNLQENRVLALNLKAMSLAGSVPSDLQYCSAATILDLSSNAISGPIPNELCSWLPYLVTLDLSNNNLTGGIPPTLSNCNFLNTLVLAGNQLRGTIPATLARLNRLSSLDLSSNQLYGSIPPPLGDKFDANSFDGNDGLCGHPVSSRCGRSHTRTNLIIIVAAGVFGAAASLTLAYVVWRCWSPSGKRAAAGRRGEDGGWWAERLRTAHNRLVPVSLFQKPIVKVKLADLMTATADFHPNNIIVAGSPRTGTSYKAVLPDGSALTVKRLRSCPLPEKQFRAEMGRIGPLRHPNLAPLLGFCIVEDERLLVYKHMPNGALFSALESVDDALDWPARVRIGIGAARGLAWLHHGFQIPFLHQNLSSKAILLDEDNEARITDFGSLGGKGDDDEIIQVLKIASGCVVAQLKERPSMYKVFQALKTVGEQYNISEQFDEFPLVYGKDELDTQSDESCCRLFRSTDSGWDEKEMGSLCDSIGKAGVKGWKKKSVFAVGNSPKVTPSPAEQEDWRRMGAVTMVMLCETACATGHHHRSLPSRGLLGGKCGCSCSLARRLLPANLHIFKAFASSRKSEKKLRNDRKISKTTQRKDLLSKDFMDMSDEAPSGNDTDFSNRIELANNNLGANGSTSYPTRGQVLQACSITSGLLLALGATIRQAAHVASVEGWAVLDSSEVSSVGFEMWHLELILGLVLLISSCRYLLLKTWPDFSRSSEAANQQILSSLEPLDYILVAFLPGISEELLFRGALMPLFGLNWRSALAVAAIFGVLHLGSGRRYSFAIWATFVGFAYGAATLISSSIIVPMASHSLNNLVGGLLWRLTSSNPKEQDK